MKRRSVGTCIATSWGITNGSVSLNRKFSAISLEMSAISDLGFVVWLPTASTRATRKAPVSSSRV